jgi:RNA polymerase sigma-70 factor (ECF subfamily)
LSRTEGFGCSAGTSDPANVLIRREQLRRVFNALTRLPYDQREVFVLRVQGSMKFKEIAELQDVSIKTVLSRYRYGIEKLRALLERHDVK